MRLPKTTVVVSVAICMLLIGGGFFIVKYRQQAANTRPDNGDSSHATSSLPDEHTSSVTGSQETNAPRTVNPPITATITLDEAGFHPSAIYLDGQASVVWKNVGTTEHQVRITTNPYAPNPPYADMVSPVLQPGQTYTYTFHNTDSTVPSVGYYDATMPNHTGSIAFQ